MSAAQVELSDPPSDAISALKFAPTGLRLLVASWDKHVYLYDTAESGGRLLEKFEYRAPVLDVCFGEDEKEAFTAGLDWDVRKTNLSTGEQTILSSHSAGVKSVVYSPPHSMLISASWDSTLHIHHPSHPSQVPTTIHLPSKPFSLSPTPPKSPPPSTSPPNPSPSP
ncbi:WD40/YVTN repeat-like-containing domain [Lasallia pustulata]|uniref:WD40/YVTN repeat-like-containing domain n=1 Tax=Lasallia pustulata TaxID=136370 RepID=A0A1W5DAR5_9LECA|nr:WD40/YVTN repeat-like-containing domain [Lasallia pustulata]